MPGPQQQPTQTTRVELTPLQTELMQAAAPALKSGLDIQPQPFVPQPAFQAYQTRQAPTGPDPSQTRGQEMALTAAGTQAGLAGQAATGLGQYTSGDIWNPENNPHLKGAIDAAIRPVQEELERAKMPGIRDEFVKSGYGASKQGIAEGLAASEAVKTAGEIGTKMSSDLYRTNVDAQLRALGLTPEIQGAQIVAPGTVAAVGDVRQAQAEKTFATDEATRYFNYQQDQASRERDYEIAASEAQYKENAALLPFIRGKEMIAAVQGIPGAGTTTTANVPLANRLMQSLGGGLTGASLGTMLGGAALGGPIGAVGGAALPFLFNR